MSIEEGTKSGEEHAFDSNQSLQGALKSKLRRKNNYTCIIYGLNKMKGDDNVMYVNLSAWVHEYVCCSFHSV